MRTVKTGWALGLAVALMGALGGCHGLQRDARGDIPEVPREFRAAWVATVANIDWPSTKTLTPEQQREELIAILDRCVELKLNAIILQVRPTGDALYDSDLEPWSEYLTNQIGQAPDPYYDPLAFAVEEAHRRGIELHAWFNPYRVMHPNNKSEPSPDHLANARPDLVRTYGKYQWLDPGEPDVQAHSLAVMLDVVNRYDLDGIHLDDYFYPYPIKDEDGNDIEFPDEPSYSRYRESGGRLLRDNWRRRNVDHFIRDLYRQVKKAKPHVKVGISPFGIYRPGDPANIQGFDQYDKLYADALRWYHKGWLDYFTPQLYWAIAPPPQSFVSLLQWWDGQNKRDRHLWPGLYTSRLLAEDSRGFTPQEISYQVQWTRTVQSSSMGHVHFSMKSLMPGEGLDALTGKLAEDVYGEPALVPATPWLAGQRPSPPAGEWELNEQGDVVVRLRPEVPEDFDWVAQVKRGDAWSWAYQPRGGREVVVPGPAGEEEVSDPEVVVLFALDRRGVRSVKVEALRN